MLLALVNNERTEAKPHFQGICPYCGNKVISKCGEIYNWHWAHAKDDSCDSWSEPETLWHYHWKMLFGIENVEVNITKDGKRHIADVLTTNNEIIEMQNSPIQKGVIKERENFYGEKMLWLINGRTFNNFYINDYCYVYNDQEKRDILVDGKENEDLDFFYYWDSPRKNWESVQQPVFIDFGGDKLFCVKKGMGSAKGKGSFVPVEKFIIKHGGNLEKYSMIEKISPVYFKYQMEREND